MAQRASSPCCRDVPCPAVLVAHELGCAVRPAIPRARHPRRQESFSRKPHTTLVAPRKGRRSRTRSPSATPAVSISRSTTCARRVRVLLPRRPVGSFRRVAKAAIDATFDTAHDSGHKTRTITVYSNDPAQPVTNLSLAGEIDAEVAADPPALYVGHLQRGQAARNEVRLLSWPNAALLTGRSAHGKFLDASLRSVAGGHVPPRCDQAGCSTGSFQGHGDGADEECTTAGGHDSCRRSRRRRRASRARAAE